MNKERSDSSICYLCQPNGDKARRSIQAALKVWKRKRHMVNGVDRTPEPSWGDTHDWTLPPARAASWTAKAYRDKVVEIMHSTFKEGVERVRTTLRLGVIEVSIEVK